jgi:hypothetical protein
MPESWNCKILGAVGVVIEEEIRVVEDIREGAGMRPVVGAGAGVRGPNVNPSGLAAEEPGAFGLADEVGTVHGGRAEGLGQGAEVLHLTVDIRRAAAA